MNKFSCHSKSYKDFALEQKFQISSTRHHPKQCSMNFQQSPTNSNNQSFYGKMNQLKPKTNRLPDQQMLAKSDDENFPYQKLLLQYINNNLLENPIEKAVQGLMKYMEELETLIKAKDKQLLEQVKMNEILQIALGQKDQIYKEVVKDNLNLKQLVFDMQLKEKNKQNRYSSLRQINVNGQKSGSNKLPPLDCSKVQPSLQNNNNQQQINSHDDSPPLNSPTLQLNSPSNLDHLNQSKGNAKLDQSLNENDKILNSSKIKFSICFPSNQLANLTATSNFANPQGSGSQNNANITDFIQHSTDFGDLNAILDLNADDAQIKQQILQNEHIQLLRPLVNDEYKFKQFLINLDRLTLLSFIESNRYLLNLNDVLLSIILKIKKILMGVGNMNSSLVLSEAFETIINETCKILSCDRSSVFLVDRKRNEIWTKVAKGSGNIRVPMGTGIAGSVAQKGELLNIIDAHSDHRFNPENDKRTNYHTKTILCVPIYRKDSTEVVGILQAINKNEGFFTKDDEGLIKILAQLAESVLKNSLQHDQKVSFQNSQRELLNMSIQLNQCRNLKSLLKFGDKKIQSFFDSPMSRIYLYDDKLDKMIYLKEGELMQTEKDFGIVGSVYQSKKILSVANMYNHQQFNSLVDIETNLPVVSVPIYSKNKSICYGVFQIVNQKGIENLVHDNGNITLQQNMCDAIDNMVSIIIQIIRNLKYFQSKISAENEIDRNFIDYDDNQ